MRPAAHFNWAMSLLGILYVLNGYSPFSSFYYDVLFIVAAVCVDLDIVSTYVSKETNHRNFLTHNLLVWHLVLVIGYLTNFEPLFWLALAIVTHLYLDVIDWGLPLFSIRNKTYMLPHVLHYSTKTLEQEIYWKNRTMVALEVILAFLGVISWLSYPFDVKYFFLLIGIFTYSYSIYDVYQLVRKT